MRLGKMSCPASREPSGKLVLDRSFDEGMMFYAETPVRMGVGTVGIIDEVIVYPRALREDEAERLAR